MFHFCSSDDTPKLSAFFSPLGSVYLEAKTSGEVEVDFLPFSVGERQCSVIFLNETIGEFLYSIEAKSSLPLPSALPYTPSSHSVRISSAAAAGRNVCNTTSVCCLFVCFCLLGGDDNMLYWKCELFYVTGVGGIMVEMTTWIAGSVNCSVSQGREGVCV